MRIHFFDTESSGLIDKNPEAEVIEYAGAIWEDGEVTGRIHAYVVPQLPVHPKAAEVNGYTEELWRKRGACIWNLNNSRELGAWFEGAMIGGSNPDFDKKLIVRESKRAGVKVPAWHYKHLDLGSFGLLLQLEGEIENARLETLAAYFGIPHEAHTAMGDVEAAIKVWEACHDHFMFRPRIARQALINIAEQATEDGDTELAEYASNASEGIEG